jgi:hypothetical protein
MAVNGGGFRLSSNSRPVMAVLAFLGAALWASSARATPDFPGAVEQCLKLPSGTVTKIEGGACGCPLCHTDGCVGGASSLSAFGSLMQEYGAIPYQAAQTACTTLDGIQATYPQLVADLNNGTDPNQDPVLSGEGGVRYGCQFGFGPSAEMSAGLLVLIAGGILIARRRRTTSPQ